MGDTGFEIILKTGHGRRQLFAPAFDELLAGNARQRGARSMVDGTGRGDHFPPTLLGDLRLQIPQLVGQAPLTQTLGEDFFHGSDKSRRPVSYYRDRIAKLTGFQIAQKLATGSGVFFGAG